MEFLEKLLGASSLNTLENLKVIAQQGIMNNQQVAQLTQNSFLALQTKMDIAESYAAQGLERGTRANDFAALNAADRTPVVKSEKA